MERQWVVELDTGRFGDWVVVRARDEEGARRQLTRTQRKRVLRARPVYDAALDGVAKLKRRR